MRHLSLCDTDLLSLDQSESWHCTPWCLQTARLDLPIEVPPPRLRASSLAFVSFCHSSFVIVANTTQSITPCMQNKNAFQKEKYIAFVYDITLFGILILRVYICLCVCPESKKKMRNAIFFTFFHDDRLTG